MLLSRAQIAIAIGMGNIARRTMAKPGIESTKFRYESVQDTEMLPS